MNGEGGEDVFGLRHEGEAAADPFMRRKIGDVVAAQGDAAPEHRHDTGDGLHEGGLARAIGAQHHDQFARLYRKVDAAHDRQVAFITGNQAARRQGGGAHAAMPR